MKKMTAIFLLAIFVNFISAHAYVNEETSSNFKLSQSSLFSLSESKGEFSLKKNYQEEIEGMNVLFFGYERYGFQEYSRGSSKVESLKQEIMLLKKKKRSSLFGAIGTGALGGGLFYLFIIYKAGGQSQERERETAQISAMKILPLAGAAVSWAITITLIGDMKKKGKAIKAYEEELKKLGEEQKK
jgi:hypothetical protein